MSLSIPLHIFSLFCTEDSVAGITQAGLNVVFVVKVFIDSCYVNIDVGIFILDRFHVLGRCHMTHETNAVETMELEAEIPWSDSLNFIVEVSLLCMMLNLCCTNGWSMICKAIGESL